MTTKGDLTPATGANTLTRLAVGSNGYPLIADSACNAGMRWETHFSASNGVLVARGGSPQSASIGGWILLHNSDNTQTFGIKAENSSGGSGLGVYAGSTLIAQFRQAELLLGTSASNTQSAGDFGVVIDTGIGNFEAIAIKGPVNHGTTSTTETDTALVIGVGANDGGRVAGYRGSGAAGTNTALDLVGMVIAACADKSATAKGGVGIFGQKISGTTASTMAANENLLVIGNLSSASTKFIFDADGDLHADAAVTASAYDAYDDAQLVRALEVERNPEGVIRGEFDDWLKYNRTHLEAAKIATFNDGPGGDGSVFVNVMGLQRLHSGAIWQMYTENQRLKTSLAEAEARLERIEQRVLALTGG